MQKCSYPPCNNKSKKNEEYCSYTCQMADSGYYDNE